jgi:hypothetical protein
MLAFLLECIDSSLVVDECDFQGSELEDGSLKFTVLGSPIIEFLEAALVDVLEDLDFGLVLLQLVHDFLELLDADSLLLVDAALHTQLGAGLGALGKQDAHALLKRDKHFFFVLGSFVVRLLEI